MARYRHPLTVDVKRDPTDNTIGHLYSYGAFIILPIEQTKERLLVSKQLTTFARRSCPRSYQISLRTFSHLSSLVSIVPLGTIPDGGDSAASQWKNAILQRARSHSRYLGDISSPKKVFPGNFNTYIMSTKTMVRRTKSSNLKYRGDSRFPPGIYTIHLPSTCEHTLENRPIHLKISSAYEGKEVMQFTSRGPLAEILSHRLHDFMCFHLIKNFFFFITYEIIW